MIERFEEDLGRHHYVTLAQVKDYLSISSNTYDARLSNIISYASGVIEHYIGQEILANNYTELFDGGVSSVFVNRLPLNNVHQVTEFNGTEHVILNNPTTIGTAVSKDTDSITFSYSGATNNSKVKRFGKSSVKFDNNDYLFTTDMPASLKLGESDFTIEMMVRVEEDTLQDNVVFSLNTDSANYLKLSLANSTGLSLEANINSISTTVEGANNFIEAQNFKKRKWAHIAASYSLSDERMYLFYNGNTIANTEYSVENHTFTSNIKIGETFKGYIDELRVSDIVRFSSNFAPPTHRYSTDDNTVLLMHFDEKPNVAYTTDSHATDHDFIFTRDTGEITKDIGSATRTYPGMSIFGLPKFAPYPSGVKVEYRAGYEADSIPNDLTLATLDYIKILYKHEQEKSGFTFEGEKGDTFKLSGNFPPHIRRVLDLYRIIY